MAGFALGWMVYVTLTAGVLSEVTAAWAQAVFSVVAIAASVGFAVSDAERAKTELAEARRREREAYEREEARQQRRTISTRQAALAMIAHARSILDHAAEMIPGQPPELLEEAALTHAGDCLTVEGQLQSFPVYDLDAPDLLAIFASVHANVSAARLQLEQMSRRVRVMRAGVAENTVDCLRNYSATLLQAEGAFTAHLAAM